MRACELTRYFRRIQVQSLIERYLQYFIATKWPRCNELINIGGTQKRFCNENCGCCGNRVTNINDDFGAANETNYLELVGDVIKDLTNDYRHMYSGVTEFERPERELFLWALLLKRKSLAVVFWRLGCDHVGGALMASVLSKSLAEVADQEDELDLAGQLQDDAL